MGYANPDAVTQIANGLSTTTFSYDNNGNLAQKITDGVTTTWADAVDPNLLQFAGARPRVRPHHACWH